MRYLILLLAILTLSCESDKVVVNDAGTSDAQVDSSVDAQSDSSTDASTDSNTQTIVTE